MHISTQPLLPTGTVPSLGSFPSEPRHFICSVRGAPRETTARTVPNREQHAPRRQCCDVRLLRTRRKRPSGDRSTNKGDELATSYARHELFVRPRCCPIERIAYHGLHRDSALDERSDHDDQQRRGLVPNVAACGRCSSGAVPEQL